MSSSDAATFEWDEYKAYFNERRHGVSFAEATSVFGDSHSLTEYDLDHSGEEDRWNTIGLSDQGRFLRVCHTWRGTRVRIISARKATREEQAAYEER
jgi:uncharacterized protein